MKHILVCLQFLVFLFSATAQNQVRGKIIDKETKEPIPSATIYIPDLKIGTSTDTNGYFILNNTPKGKFLIEVKMLSYSSQAIYADATNEKFLEIELSQSAGELQAIVVTGVSKATEIRRSAVPIVSINHDYLISNASTNAIDAIANVPGVTAVTTGPNVSKPFIRGLGFNRILTLYDGMRQEGQQWGDEHGIEIDQYGVDKVEIIKGPASLSYGSDALAGVVNLIPTQPASEGKLLGDITMDYATNNGQVGGSAMAAATKKGIDFSARISHKQATNYQNSFDGRVFGTGFNETDASASVGIHRAGGYSHLGFSLYDNLQEIPDGSRDSVSRKFTRQTSEADTVREIVSGKDLQSYKIEKLHQHVQHYRVYSSSNFLLGKQGSLELNLGYQRSVRREFSHPVLSEIPGLYLQLNTFNYDLKYHLSEIKDWNLSLGINGMYQNNVVTKGTDFVIPSYNQFDFGPFAVVKKSFKKFDLEAGLRYDIRVFNNQELYTKPNADSGFDMPVYGSDTIGSTQLFSKTKTVYQGISGSIGATYNVSEQLCLKLNLARGFRAPNIAEISANGIHPGTNIYQLGSSNFKPEANWQPDFGIAYNSKHIVFSVDIFYNYIQNYIYNQKLQSKLGGDSVLVAGNQTFQFQSATAQLYGGELSVDIHPIKGLHIDNGLSLVYADFLEKKGQAVADSEKYLPQIPPLHGTTEVRYDFNIKPAHIVNAFIKTGITYYAPQNRFYSAFGTETATGGYILWNAGIGASFTDKKGKAIVTFYVLGNNLLNTSYQDHLNRLKYFEPYPTNNSSRNGIFNMGRNIVFKVNFPLDFKI